MKFLKIFGIGILVICILAVIPVTREYISLYQIYVGGSSSGGGSYAPPTNSGSSGQAPSTSEDNVQTYKGVWHTSKHNYHHFEPITCNGCGEVFKDSSLFEAEIIYESNVCFVKTVEACCPKCGSTDGNFRTELTEYHCYIDGICHDCSQTCSHKATYSEGTDYSKFLSDLQKPCTEHPLLSSEMQFVNGSSFVENGSCYFCLCSDDDEKICYLSSDGYMFEKGVTIPGYYLVGYKGISSDITIPSEFNGAPVVGINSNSFKNTKVTYIKIPSSVMYINDYAFKGCIGLKYVFIYGADNTTISDNAFSGLSDSISIIIDRYRTSDDISHAPWGASGSLGYSITYNTYSSTGDGLNIDTAVNECIFVCDCYEIKLPFPVYDYCDYKQYYDEENDITYYYDIVCKYCGKQCEVDCWYKHDDLGFEWN